MTAIPQDVMKKYFVLGYAGEGTKKRLVIHDPLDLDAFDVLRFRVGAEPWLKRIESIRLTPQSDGQAVRLSLRLTTPFMPGRSAGKPLVADPSRLQAAERYSALFASNPFRVPPPP
ncbi:MAG: hypothetical protein ACK55I_21605, partial [bacterium]